MSWIPNQPSLGHLNGCDVDRTIRVCTKRVRRHDLVEEHFAKCIPGHSVAVGINGHVVVAVTRQTKKRHTSR